MMIEAFGLPDENDQTQPKLASSLVQEEEKHQLSPKEQTREYFHQSPKSNDSVTNPLQDREDLAQLTQVTTFLISQLRESMKKFDTLQSKKN